MEENKFESVYSSKVKAGKRRTYFFDVRKTKGEDYYITLTESTKRYNGDGYDRHKIFLYKEDFDRFQKSLAEVISHIKTELMPNYDYEEYTRRQEEWETKVAEEGIEAAMESREAAKAKQEEKTETDADADADANADASTEEKTESAEDDEMTW